MRGHHPAVLVLDLNMPGGSSLEAIPVIREECPATQIVVLTMQQEPAFAREALGDGALGYVLKEAADDELVEAVRRAAAGESYLNPRLGARLASEPPPGPPDDLSEREVEVLRLIALGHTNAEIAERLYPVRPHGRDPPLAHPAEAAPLLTRRARRLRARARADQDLIAGRSRPTSARERSGCTARRSLLGMTTADSQSSKLSVLIAGGGVAALETVLALATSPASASRCACWRRTTSSSTGR